MYICASCQCECLLRLNVLQWFVFILMMMLWNLQWLLLLFLLLLWRFLSQYTHIHTHTQINTQTLIQLHKYQFKYVQNEKREEAEKKVVLWKEININKTIEWDPTNKLVCCIHSKTQHTHNEKKIIYLFFVVYFICMWFDFKKKIFSFIFAVSFDFDFDFGLKLLCLVDPFDLAQTKIQQLFHRITSLHFVFSLQKEFWHKTLELISNFKKKPLVKPITKWSSTHTKSQNDDEKSFNCHN